MGGYYTSSVTNVDHASDLQGGDPPHPHQCQNTTPACVEIGPNDFRARTPLPSCGCREKARVFNGDPDLAAGIHELLLTLALVDRDDAPKGYQQLKLGFDEPHERNRQTVTPGHQQ